MDENISDMKKRSNRGTSSLVFKDNLAQIMKDRSLSLKQISALSEVSISVVQNWLEGKNPHDLIAVNRLAEKLGVQFKKFLLGIPEKIDAPTALSDLYEESELFEGLCKIQIKKLNPKKDSK